MRGVDLVRGLIVGWRGQHRTRREGEYGNQAKQRRTDARR
jgi:hypothetical protein